ncbi:MAG TPA: PqqD family protein [Acidimicrobiales bacterium]|nr:PqqD family protein [Acidimicrobiales bacterium]
MLTVADDVILHEEEGEAFLLHVASGRYFGLNKSGLVVWQAFADGADPIDRLTARWPERPADALRADAGALTEQLLQAGLIHEAADAPDC